MKKKLIVFTGPSGVGKHTIEKELLKDKNLNIQFSISATTRKPRSGEKDGIDYHFISQKEFDNKIKNDDFIEWNQHFSHKYGTLKSEVQKIFNQNKIPFIEVEVIGAKNIIENFGNKNLVSIFISSPSKEEIKKRILTRNTETKDQVKQRMLRLEEEMKYVNLFDHVIVNDKLANCVEKVKTIIQGIF